MSAANDDAVPQASYPYFWHAKSDVTLQEFLTKYKPSMVQNDGSKPWLWVEKGESKWDADTQKASQEAAVICTSGRSQSPPRRLTSCSRRSDREGGEH